MKRLRVEGLCGMKILSSVTLSKLSPDFPISFLNLTLLLTITNLLCFNEGMALKRSES